MTEPVATPYPKELVDKVVRELDLWSDDHWRETLDAHDMAIKILDALADEVIAPR